MANQPIRRAPQKRTASKKRKKNKRQSYLYIAVFFVFVAMAIATAIICIMAGCEEDIPDVSYESEQGAESSQEVLESSVPESNPDVSEISVIFKVVVKSIFSASLSLTELTNEENDVLSPLLKSRERCDVLTPMLLASFSSLMS